MKIEFYKHNIGNDEKQKVLECLDGIFLTTGEYVTEFENKFAEYLKLPYSAALTSCTAALHLSLLALGIGPGDEVITTPLTYVSTVNAILYCGAIPVFVDVEKDTGLMNPELIESAVTEKTSAIIPVHLYGQMCDMKRIRTIADKYNLKIVEDSAHCLEGTRDGIRPGQLGEVACFSFYATKSMTCGEGGAIATKDESVYRMIKILRALGITKEASNRHASTYQHWDQIECGWKYNMTNIQAALLLPQLDKIDRRWQVRDSLYRRYVKLLQSVKAVDYPRISKNCKNACHLFTVWADSAKRDSYLEKLGKAGIGVAVNYRPVHLLTYYKQTLNYKRGDFPVAEYIGDRTISLPFYVNLTPAKAEYVVKVLQGLFPQ